MARRNRPEEESGDPNFWMSTFSDLLNLLLTFFVLLFAMKSMDKGKLREALGYFRGGGMGALELGSPSFDSMPQLLKSITPTKKGLALSHIRELVKKKGLSELVHLSSDKRGIVLMLYDDVLFKLGTAELMPDAQDLLEDVVEVLMEIDYSVRIEGHTDNIPISGVRYASNWDLSTARANHVLTNLLESGELQAERFSVAGYADTRPVAKNDSPENRRRNRRVEFVLLR